MVGLCGADDGDHAGVSEGVLGGVVDEDDGLEEGEDVALDVDVAVGFFFCEHLGEGHFVVGDDGVEEGEGAGEEGGPVEFEGEVGGGFGRG